MNPVRESLNKRTIVTYYSFPAVPIRWLDWVAYIEDDERDGTLYGHGRTEIDAILDLINNWKDKEDEI